MDNKNKRSIRLVIIGIVTLVVATFSITYAYFSSQRDINNSLNINATTGGGSYILIISSESNIDFNMTESKMFTSSISTIAVDHQNSNISLTLSSPDSTSTTICSYDLVWEWISSDQYIDSNGTIPYVDSITLEEYPYQFSVMAQKNVSSDTSSFIYTDGDMNESDLSSFIWSKQNGESENKAVIHNGQIASRSTSPTIVNWNITSNIYNIPVDQEYFSGKNFKAKIYVDNVECKIYDQTP